MLVCGRLRAINIIAKAYLKRRFVGYDISKEGIRVSKHESIE
jgi:hypothetical protein